MGCDFATHVIFITDEILLCVFPFFVQLCIPEVQKHINGDHDKVQEIEGPAQEEDPAVAAVGKHDEVLGNTEDVADPDEDFKLQALTLGGPGLPGLVYGQGPAEAKADDHDGFT